MALHDQLGQTLTAARLLLKHAKQVQLSWVDTRLNRLREGQGLVAALKNQIHHIATHSETVDIFYISAHSWPWQRFSEELEHTFYVCTRVFGQCQGARAGRSDSNAGDWARRGLALFQRSTTPVGAITLGIAQ